MKTDTFAETNPDESENTGLSWPRTWHGVYAAVFASFIFWIILLVALTEFFA